MNVLNFGVPLEAEFWRIVYLMARCGAALVAAPIFAAPGVPPLVRLTVAGALAIFVSIWLPVGTLPAVQSFAGIVGIFGEVALGLALGFVLQIAFAAPILAAELVGGGMGMSMAVGTSPDGSGQTPVLGQFFTIALTIIFLGSGGHLIWLRLLVESYATFPPGSAWLVAERMHEIALFGGTIFLAGLAIALPITVVLLLTQLTTGILSRSAPQLNIFALGLPIGVLAGLTSLIVTAPIVFDGLGDLGELAVEQAARTVP